MKAILLFNLALLSFLFVIPCAYGEPDIDVEPPYHDFGEVEVGLSETVTITIKNVGNSSIAVESISFKTGSSDYDINSIPYLPVFFGPGGSVKVEITFTPLGTTLSSAVLEIKSSDPDDGIVEVSLTGLGFSAAVTPLEQIEAIIDFVDSSVTEGSLSGKGPGNSGKPRLNSWIKILHEARSSIVEASYGKACKQLNSAYKYIDGESQPPDFVTGPAAAELVSKILKLIETLGCN